MLMLTSKSSTRTLEKETHPGDFLRICQIQQRCRFGLSFAPLTLVSNKLLLLSMSDWLLTVYPPCFPVIQHFLHFQMKVINWHRSRLLSHPWQSENQWNLLRIFKQQLADMSRHICKKMRSDMDLVLSMKSTRIRPWN